MKQEGPNDGTKELLLLSGKVLIPGIIAGVLVWLAEGYYDLVDIAPEDEGLIGIVAGLAVSSLISPFVLRGLSQSNNTDH